MPGADPVCGRTFTRRRLERYILPGCLVVLLLTLVIRNVVFRETLRYTLQGLALAPLLYYVVHVPETRVGRLLNSRMLGRLGILSYSLYLLHGTVLLEMNRLLHAKLLSAMVAFIFAVGLAELVHVLIEKPTDRLRKQLRHTESSSRESFVARPLCSQLNQKQIDAQCGSTSKFEIEI